MRNKAVYRHVGELVRIKQKNIKHYIKYYTLNDIRHENLEITV